MPRLASKPKVPLASLSLKVPQRVRDRLEQQAAESGRSLTQEATQQIMSGLAAGDAAIDTIERTMGGPEMFALFQAMAGTAGMIEAKTGKKWSEDIKTYVAVETAMRQLIQQHGEQAQKQIKDAFAMLPDPGPQPQTPIPPLSNDEIAKLPTKKRALVAKTSVEYDQALAKYLTAIVEWSAAYYRRDELRMKGVAETWRGASDLAFEALRKHERTALARGGPPTE